MISKEESSPVSNAASSSAPSNKVHENESKVISAMMAFTFLFAPVKDGLGPLVSVFLVVVKGWTPGEAGLIWFLRDGTALFSSPFVGAFVDRSRQKRLLLLASTAFSAVAASAVIWTDDLAVLAATSIIAGMAASLIQPAKSAVSST